MPYCFDPRPPVLTRFTSPLLPEPPQIRPFHHNLMAHIISLFYSQIPYFTPFLIKSFICTFSKLIWNVDPVRKCRFGRGFKYEILVESGKSKDSGNGTEKAQE